MCTILRTTVRSSWLPFYTPAETKGWFTKINSSCVIHDVCLVRQTRTQWSNCFLLAAFTRWWQKDEIQPFHQAISREFLTLQKYAAKNASFDFMFSILFLRDGIWNSAQLCCISTHFSQDFQRSCWDNRYIEKSMSTKGCECHVELTQPWWT